MGLVIVDTNIVIYAIKGIPVIEPYMVFDFVLSDISVIELLGVKNIDDNSLQVRKNFIDTAYSYPVNHDIKELAIKIKQKHIVKVPDALIAATALFYDLPLLTADKDFKKITELNSIIISL